MAGRVETLGAYIHRNITVCDYGMKQAHRDYLRESNARVAFVYLKGSDPVIRKRLTHRQAHFAKEDLLLSLLSVIEELMMR